MSANIVTTDEFNSFQEKVFNRLDKIDNLLQEKTTTKKWMKSTEVRDLLGISHGTLQTLRNNNILKFSRIQGILYYDIEDVNKLLEENRSK